VLDVVAIGDICVDILTPPLERFSLGDRQLWLPAMPMVPGGNAANFALGCAALGLRTGLAACLGGDPLSPLLMDALRRGRVVSFVKIRRALEAGRTIALTHVDGSRQLLTYNGSNLAFAPSDVPPRALRARHVHRAGYWWTPKLQGKPTRDLLRKARDGGAETSLDISTDPEGWPDSRRAKVLSVLPQVSIFFGNEEEVCGVFDVRQLGIAAKEAFAIGVEVLAVHRGTRGSSVFIRGGRFDAPAFKVTPRNPTGTGDLFNAGFVRARLDGYDIPRCARFANAVAAQHLRGPRSYPSLSDVARRIPSR
jgi:sugar/nucleoside kinase (ribokinase family)